jgi:hypothetical protein
MLLPFQWNSLMVKHIYEFRSIGFELGSDAGKKYAGSGVA